MKKSTLYLALVAIQPFLAFSQVVSPIATTGYNLDAIAENTTAMANTGGAIDGSDYVMYSQAYGALYSSSAGLPNSGLVSSGTRTYQLQPYTGSNVLYRLPGQMDTIVFTTPAAYGALSVLSFATEGAVTLNLTVRFTDNTTQQFSNLSVPDWFNTGNVVISGYDRCGRTSGTPNFQTTQPKMFYNDLILSCANRQKNVAKIIVHNSGNSGRLCFMAVSGITAPVFSVSVTPVSCSGGTNGSATISVTGGIGPFGYTTATSPAQFNPVITNLATGVYSYTAQDAGICPVNATFAVTQSLVAQPSLTVAPSPATVCPGTSITLTVSGASTYTWANGSQSATVVIQPTTSFVFTVSGLTAENCLRTGAVPVLVQPIPTLTAVSSNTLFCENGPCVTLNAFGPSGGTYSGPGVTNNSFCPSGLPNGTVAIQYVFTTNNGCMVGSNLAFSVAVTPVPTISPVTPVCANAPAFTLNASPSGGIFSGQGISGPGIVTPFNPGVFPFTYTLFNGQCKTTAGAAYTIYSLTPVTFTIAKTVFCPNSSNVAMNGNPSTGTFSGPGVNGSFFSPATAGAGTHSITYSFTNSSGCVSTTAKTVTVSTCTGLDENAPGSFGLFPNPNNGEFSITGDAGARVLLFDQLGRQVRQVEMMNGKAVVSDLAAGVYFVVYERGGTLFRHKMLVSESGGK
jgi:hypothetical protein